MCADKEYDSDSDEEQVVEEPVVEEPQEDATLNNPDVVTKYQEAAKIAQAVMVEVMGKCITGAKVVDICKFGDELIEQKTAAIFRNKNKAGKHLIRGVAFPVCISVNEIVCHCSPLESDESYLPLAVGDIVKIDLGVHIDGFMALLAHTIIVDLESVALPAEQIAARNAAINATWTALEVAVKLLKPGNTNAQVTGAIKQVAEAYEVRPIANSVMHQVKQFVIDGNKTILLREEPEQQKVESCTFETGDVFAIDIAMSTGDGKPRDIGARTTVYKRQVDRKYSLKNKSSRQFFNEVNKRYPTLPFSTRSFADEKAAKLGVRECVNHELLASYPVLNEKKGDFVAHAKATVLLLPSGNTAQITGLAPFTYIQAIQAQETKESGSVTTDVKELATKLSAPLSIGSTLARVLQAEKNVTLSETVMELLNQAPVESKKKAKKAKKAAAKAAEEGK